MHTHSKELSERHRSDAEAETEGEEANFFTRMLWKKCTRKSKTVA